MSEGWQKVRLGDVVSPIAKRMPDPESRFTYIDIASVSSAEKAITSPQQLTGSEAPGRARQTLKPDDVLVSTVRPNLNAVAMVHDKHVDPVGSTGFCVLRASASILPGYLFALVRSNAFVQAMTELASGSNYPAVTNRVVLDWTFNLPPLAEQRRIVDLIAALDNAIETNLECSRAVEGAQTKAVEALTASWGNGRLSELVVALEGGKSPAAIGRSPEPGEAGVLKVSAVGELGFLPKESKVVLDTSVFSQRMSVRKGDLLVTRANTSERVGMACVVEEDHADLFLSDKTLRMVPQKGVPADAICALMSMSETRKQMLVAATGTSASMKNISQPGFMRLLVPITDIESELSALGTIFSDFQTTRRAHQANGEELEDLRSQLLTALLSGVHEIPESYDETIGREHAGAMA